MFPAFKKIRGGAINLLHREKHGHRAENTPILGSCASSSSYLERSSFLIRLPITVSLTLDSFTPSHPAQPSFAIVSRKGEGSEHVVVVARAVLEQKKFRIVNIWPIQDILIEKVPFNGLPVIRLTIPNIIGIRDTQYWVFESEFDLATFFSRAPLRMPVNVTDEPQENPLEKKKKGAWRFLPSVKSMRDLKIDK